MSGAFVNCLLAVAIGGPPTACPAEEAVAAELERLGVSAATEVLGAPEIAIEGTKMRVVFRGRDGSMLGARDVKAPASCHERASLAAVLIAAWVRTWPAPMAESQPLASADTKPATAPALGAMSTARPGIDSEVPAVPTESAPSDTGPPEAGPSPTSIERSPAQPPVDASPTAPSPPSSALPPAAHGMLTARVRRSVRPRTEIAGWGLGTYDGDAAALGVGMLIGYRYLPTMAFSALFETVSERETALGPVAAIYRTYRLGLGASTMRSWGPLFLDAGLFPALTMLKVRGKHLTVGKRVTTWGAELDLRVRFGLTIGRFVPFVFMGGSGALRAQRLTLDDYPQVTTLSRWNLGAGVGLAFLLGKNE